MHLDKEIHVISMIDGSRQFIYQNLLTAANDPNTVHTNLFVARMLLNPDNTITQGMSKVYHLLDEAGRHINVTDCQTLLKPNGEMLITCVGLNAYEANSIIALEINSDGTVKTAQTVRKLKGAFIGSTIVRSGDYNGADSTAGEFNLAVFTHFVEFRSVVIFYAPDGEEIEVVEPQPVPTTTPEVPTPTSTPIVIVPIPTETIQPASNTVFLPLTRK
jgi:hypothetical protein